MSVKRNENCQSDKVKAGSNLTGMNNIASLLAEALFLLFPAVCLFVCLFLPSANSRKRASASREQYCMTVKNSSPNETVC